MTARTDHPGENAASNTTAGSAIVPRGHELAILVAVTHLQDSVSHAFESLRRVVLELHATESGGDDRAPAAAWGRATDEGSPRWHLCHILDVFRLHATTASRGELTWLDGASHEAVPDDPTATGTIASAPDTARATVTSDIAPAELVSWLERDLDRFVVWLQALPEEQWSTIFEYGRPLRLPEMLALMSRHIVWHAAMIRAALRDASGPVD